jgi:chemotaxis protein methyltransferase CheR
MLAGLELSDKEFEEIRTLVHTSVGIQLNESKRALVVARLGKRLRHLGCATFREYCEHIRHRDSDGREMLEMINCITTNKTEFFREPHHFDWLREVVVREARARTQASGVRKLRIWSAGCSTGQEPYTIAMVLSEALGDGGWDVRILASDIDTNVLAEAKAAEYPDDLAADIPERLRIKYTEQTDSGFRIIKPVRDLVTFRRVNLIEPSWSIRIRFDTIFCRNVTIYFDQKTQEVLYDRFTRHLEPHGYLVAGHSENLHWLSRLLTPIGKTVYRLTNGEPRPSRRPVVKGMSRRPPPRIPTLRPPVALRPLSHRPPPTLDVAIQSGGLHVASEPTLVRTVLGSCVAACIYDPAVGVGGMNHFMLPDGCDSDWVPMRFGSFAMEALVESVLQKGAQKDRLRAKIFGGAHVLKESLHSNPIPDGNVEFVRKFLAKEAIPIRAEKVGGDLAMMIRFETHTGRVMVRTVEGTDDGDVVRSEASYRRELNVIAKRSEHEMRAARSVT